MRRLYLDPLRVPMPFCALFVVLLACVAAYGEEASSPSTAPTAHQFWRSQAMSLHHLHGPFVSLEEYCARRRREDAARVHSCDIVRRLPDTAAIEIRTSNERRAMLLAVGGALNGGWWIDEGRRGSIGVFFDVDNPVRPNRSPSASGRGTFVLLGIEDGGGPARMRVVQSGWSRGVYYCFLFEVHCYGIRTGDKYCTVPLPLAGRDACNLGDERDAQTFDASRWDWNQEFLERGDGSGVDIRRITWSKFPTDLAGYGEWVRKTAGTAQVLAGHYQ